MSEIHICRTESCKNMRYEILRFESSQDADYYKSYIPTEDNYKGSLLE